MHHKSDAHTHFLPVSQLYRKPCNLSKALRPTHKDTKKIDKNGLITGLMHKNQRGYVEIRHPQMQ